MCDFYHSRERDEIFQAKLRAFTDGVLASDTVRLREENDRLRKQLALAETALRPVLRCPACANFTPKEQASHCMKAVADAIHIYYQGEIKK